MFNCRRGLAAFEDRFSSILNKFHSVFPPVQKNSNVFDTIGCRFDTVPSTNGLEPARADELGGGLDWDSSSMSPDQDQGLSERCRKASEGFCA